MAVCRGCQSHYHSAVCHTLFVDNGLLFATLSFRVVQAGGRNLIRVTIINERCSI